MAAPMMTQKVINRPKAAMGAKTAHKTMAISLHIPAYQHGIHGKRERSLRLEASPGASVTVTFILVGGWVANLAHASSMNPDH